MQTKVMFTQEQIEEYLPNMQDQMAASMLKLLLEDVSRLEVQIRQQKERMDNIHSKMRNYSDEVLKKIIYASDNHCASI